MSDRKAFMDAVAEGISRFPSNTLCRRIDAGSVTLPDYHAVLRTLFHQTYQGPATFALAGSHLAMHLDDARGYLLRHADEEREHWRWVINDLRATGDNGPDPRNFMPGPSTQAYVAFNWYVAQRAPIARLGIAAVLEGIGGRFGLSYGKRMCELLGLKKEQATFFLGHGELDKGHVEEVLAVIDAAPLGSEDWRWLAHAARTAGVLYPRMYDEALA